MFTDAFTADLGDFGNTEERGIIDSSSIKMTSYFGENSAGGSTTISVGNAPAEDTASEDEPRIPPWQKTADSLLSTPVTNSQEPIAETAPQPAADLLAFSKQVSQPKSDAGEVPTTAATPPPLPPEAATPTEISSEPLACHQVVHLQHHQQAHRVNHQPARQQAHRVNHQPARHQAHQVSLRLDRPLDLHQDHQVSLRLDRLLDLHQVRQVSHHPDLQLVHQSQKTHKAANVRGFNE